MKRTVLITVSVLLAAWLAVPSRAQVDSLSAARLTGMLDSYYAAMIFEDNSVKESECDFLIESCTDSLVRQFVAYSILEHYMEPPLMGEESVAVYLYEKWFIHGGVKIADSWDAFQAELFYRTNRLCLLDMPAPVLSVTGGDGAEKTLPARGPAVLYFYDIHCSKCKLMTSSLIRQLSKVKFPVTLYAFYAGDDFDGWLAYREKLNVENANVRVEHCWDPEMSSDYVTGYAVTTTPRVYFIDENMIIRGRRLEEDSLGRILQIYESYCYEKESIEKEEK